MPQLAFVTTGAPSVLYPELVETLRHELAEQDIPSTVHTDGFPEPAPDLVYVLVDPSEYLDAEEPYALPTEDLLKRTIFLSALAPPPPNRATPSGQTRAEPEWAHMRHLKLYRQAGAVFDIHLRSVAALHRSGVPARHLRLGHSSMRDRFDPAADRPIDAMFLGAGSRHRTWQLGRCARLLGDRNCQIHLIPPGGLSETSKWELLTRTRVVLNIHAHPDSGSRQLEWLRVLDAIHAGAVVVTEHSSDLAPLVPGEHLLAASAESFPFVLESALVDEDLCRRLRVAAHERIRAWLPFSLPVSVFRAAAVELVGRPANTSGALRAESPHREASHATWNAPGAGEGVTQRQRGVQLERLGFELETLRRDIAQLRKSSPEAEQVVGTQELAHETPSWALTPRPRVGVLLTISGSDRPIEPCLDSVSRSRFQDFELVLVAADSRRVDVLAWVDRHPDVAARLVLHEELLGAGAARNIGVGHLRAPHCLILEPDVRLYPRCIEVLLGSLQSLTEVTLVYPMLQVTGMAEWLVADGGDYLLSARGWDPEALRRWMPVESLAMIRVDRLRELNGFATDRRLAGWEDYDLWTRVADRGWRGELVPQILGAYHATPSSIGRYLFSGSALEALAERSPRLMAGVVPPG